MEQTLEQRRYQIKSKVRFLDYEGRFSVGKPLNLITDWSLVRGILLNSTPEAQFLKLVSEVGELADSLAKGKDVKDDIGDCLVLLNNIAILSNTNLWECLDVAWNDIKDRKGYMNEQGVFIKEGDDAGNK